MNTFYYIAFLVFCFFIGWNISAWISRRRKM
jgi:hypothetical protein